MSAKKSITTDLLHYPVGKTLLRFSLPFMFSTLLQTLYSTTDTVIVGQYLGSRGLSAVSVGSQLMQMLYMICISFSTAGQILIAQAEGAGNHDRTRKVMEALLVLETALSLFIGLVCIVFGRRFLVILNTPEEALEQAVWYTVICGAGMIFTGLYNMFSAVLRGMGDSMHPLLFVVIASVCNVILDILFITVLDWNVAGTALATVIGQAVSVLFSVCFFRRNMDVLWTSKGEDEEEDGIEGTEGRKGIGRREEKEEKKRKEETAGIERIVRIEEKEGKTETAGIEQTEGTVRKAETTRKKGRKRSPDRKICLEILRLGIPLAVQGGAVQFSFLFVSSMVNQLGLNVSAAFGVTQKIRNVPGIMTQGLQLGSSSMIGQNWGAGEKKRVSNTVRDCILFAGLINLLFGVSFLAFSTQWFRAFTSDREVLAYAFLSLLTLAIELPARSLMPGCNSLISAQGFVAFSFILAFVDAFVGRVLFCWLLGDVFGLGYFGFFLGYGIGTYLTAVPAFVYYISGLWKKRKVLNAA